MDSWVTLDSWVIPYSIIVLGIQNMMKEMSFYNRAGSSESFITLCMACSECKLYVSEVNCKFVENYG